MKRLIVWSPRALADYDQLVGYLMEHWGERIAKNFVSRLEKIIDLIGKSHLLYPATGKRKDVRRCVVSKQTSLYYRIEKEHIQIITLFDTRRHSAKRKL